VDYTPQFIFAKINTKQKEMANSLLKTQALTLLFSMLTVCACSQSKSTKDTMNKQQETVCSDDCKAQNKTGQMSCKLTTPELQKRKETVIASLKKQIIERKELKNGYAFKFLGTDEVLDELTEFIKTERECCDFFTFAISVSGDKSEAWLELTGANGAKDFIISELGL
jgi:hypothetical protein